MIYNKASLCVMNAIGGSAGVWCWHDGETSAENYMRHSIAVCTAGFARHPKVPDDWLEVGDFPPGKRGVFLKKEIVEWVLQNLPRGGYSALQYMRLNKAGEVIVLDKQGNEIKRRLNFSEDILSAKETKKGIERDSFVDGQCPSEHIEVGLDDLLQALSAMVKGGMKKSNSIHIEIWKKTIQLSVQNIESGNRVSVVIQRSLEGGKKRLK